MNGRECEITANRKDILKHDGLCMSYCSFGKCDFHFTMWFAAISFRNEDLEKHPQKVHDDFLPIKVKDEVRLADYVYRIIIPSEYKEQLMTIIPSEGSWFCAFLCNFVILLSTAFFDVLAYLVKWYLEKEEADKINRRIAEHRSRRTK